MAAPIRQAQLRTSGAFWTKAQKIGRYLEQDVIAPEDTRIVAVSASRFGVYVAEQPLPLIMTTLFPIGDAYITIDRDTGDVLEEGLHAAPLIHRAWRSAKTKNRRLSLILRQLWVQTV